MAYGMTPSSDPTNVMGRRVVAYLVDVLLSTGILVAILALTKNHVYTGAPSDACRALRETSNFSGQCLQVGSRVYTWKGGALGASYGLAALVSFVNLVVLQGVTGASIGKLIVGLRVVDAHGAPCGVGRAFVRWILLFVDSICGIVGLVVALVTHPHRRIGDMVGGTYVVGQASLGVAIPGTAPVMQYGAPPPGPPAWAPPGAAPAPAPGWGAAPPTWGAAPPAQSPTWGAPPPDASTAPPTWGAPPPASPPPAPEASPPAWGTPPPPPPPPPPASSPPAWGTPPPAPPPPPPPAPEPGSPPAVPTPAPPPDPPAEGESWWGKAFEDDDEPTQ